MNASRSSTLVLTLLFTFFLAIGCTTPVADDALAREQSIPHSDERLAQREQDLERARGDLQHFRTTRRHLLEHYSSWQMRTFDEQLERFVDERVDPLLANEWQSSHAELAQLDLDLRLARVDTLVDLNQKRSAARAVREIGRSYEGHKQMLVTRADGERETLEKSLASLRLELKRK